MLDNILSHYGDWFRAGLEILILTFLSYVVVRFVRGTRGAGVAKGALILTVLLFITLLFTATWVRLDNLRWIMENLVGVSMIGLIVIFQPELRRGLSRLGEGAWKLYGTKQVLLEKELADAAFAISRANGPGALMAIERETPIAGYMDSGIPVDADVNSKLLQTIFTKNTPLHDGAVIIRQMRLAAANCLLPLSENVEVCRGMGTRHRAAIGLSEESDAVVLVVSEENGAVSIALGGKMMQDLEYEEVIRILRRELHQIDEDSRVVAEEKA